MMSFGGQAGWVKMTSPGDKLTVLVCLPTKKVSKAEELTSLSEHKYQLQRTHLESTVGCFPESQEYLINL